MSRYITQQQHKTSCGQVAVMNALKWLGESVSYRDDIELFKQLGWKIGDGTWCTDMHMYLNYFNIRYKLHKNPSVSLMKNILKNGNSIIFNYDWIDETRNAGHLIFIDSHSGKYFNAYNITAKKNENKRFSELYTKLCFHMSKKLRKNVKKGRRAAHIWEILSDGGSK